MSEGVKHDSEKPRMALIPSGPLLEVGKVFTFGAKKYTDHNWRGGINYSRILSAAMRHLLALNEREDIDQESGLKHAAHVCANMMFLLYFQEQNRVELDDRYKKETDENK